MAWAAELEQLEQSHAAYGSLTQGWRSSETFDYVGAKAEFKSSLR